jgi:hypothetical protein
VRDHHERFDGTGYPNGLSGAAISLGGRIVAVTDSYETMTAGRPYRRALSVRAAREELVRRSGTHFDPYVVRAFLAISVARLWPVVGLGAVLAQIPFLAPVSARLTQLGPRSLSGLAATSAAVTLIAAGLAGPAAQTLVYGPSSKPATASVTTPAGTGSSIPASAPSPATNNPPAPVTSQAQSASAAQSPPPTAAGGAGKSLFPAGIAKHATLPGGIAKQLNPFANWRLHH